MVDQHRDYADDGAAAAHAVMVELVRLLAEYRDAFVIVGGWVPELLLASASSPHGGSTDVDLALDRSRCPETARPTIRQLLLASGYVQTRRPFTFQRTVTIRGRPVIVDVDFLTAEDADDSVSDRIRAVQDLSALMAPGCEVAFEMNEQRRVEGIRPDGRADAANVRVASIVAFLVMKGMVLGGRHKRYRRKDAYDVYYCINNYPGGPEALVKAFLPHMQNELVREGLAGIRAQFKSPWDTGPIYVVDVEGEEDPQTREIRERDVFEKVNYLIEKLGVA